MSASGSAREACRPSHISSPRPSPSCWPGHCSQSDRRVRFGLGANAEIQAGKPYIKRIIGVAGDRIVIQNGQVLVNGIVLDEPYLFAVDGTAQPTTAHNEASTWTVPADSLFVMGDHRERSADSRDFGPILVKDVVGRAWLRYWPLSRLEVLR